MTISRTIWVILDIFVLVWLEAFRYIWQRANLRYLKGAVVLDRSVFGNFNAGRIIRIIMRQFFHKVISSIIICKKEYIGEVRYAEYMKRVRKTRQNSIIYSRSAGGVYEKD
jgi:hypothetical protein